MTDASAQHSPHDTPDNDTPGCTPTPHAQPAGDQLDQAFDRLALLGADGTPSASRRESQGQNNASVGGVEVTLTVGVNDDRAIGQKGDIVDDCEGVGLGVVEDVASVEAAGLGGDGDLLAHVPHGTTKSVTVKYLIGDTREQIATIPDGTVSLVACSPPFIALRSYLPADHPDKNKEIGSEPDPATFLDTLLQLTAEWGRVLAPWGSIAIELGDTYAGSGGGGGDYNPGGLREGQQMFSGSSSAARRSAHDPECDMGADCSCGYEEFAAAMRESNAAHWRQKAAARDAWPRPKCLALVPQLYAASLAYGRNLLTGQPSPAGQWLVRNMIVWHRPNPAVGALGDKFRPSTSYITVATRSPKRWFDLTAVRTEGVNMHQNPATRGSGGKGRLGTDGATTAAVSGCNPAGAPPLDTWTDHHDTWTITTQPSSLAHYAMWPAKLAERLVLSMCPAEVCATCGEPRRRIEKVHYIEAPDRQLRDDTARQYGSIDGKRHNDHRATSQETLGFTDCGHNNYTPGTVLDPFAGTFTTGLVAEYHGRNVIGIDIDERNRDMVPQRREEVRRALNPTYVKPVEGQEVLF